MNVRLLTGRKAAGALGGDTLTYDDVRPGVDVKLKLVPTGLKEDVVLADRHAPRRLTYNLNLDAGDATVRTDARGDVQISRGGRSVFRIPAPTMADARGERFAGDHFEISRIDDRNWKLTLRPDRRWLDRPERAWPVAIDPTVEDPFPAPVTNECLIQTSWFFTTAGGYGVNCPLTNDSQPLVGQRTNRRGVYYVSLLALHFSTLSLVQTDRIVSARLRVHYGGKDPNNAYTPLPGGLGVFPATVPWWRPEQAANLGPTMASIRGAGPTGWTRPPIGELRFPDPWTAPGWMDTDITETVTGWQRHAQSGGTRGIANHGVVLGSQDFWADQAHMDYCTNWTYCNGALVTGGSHPDQSKRPVLEVTTLPAAPAGSRIVTPEEGALTGRRIDLQAKSIRSSVTSARFQYVAGSQRTWRDIPLTALRTTRGSPLTSIDIPLAGDTGDRRSQMAVWDLSAMPGGEVDGPVHVRAFLDSSVSGDGGVTEEVNFRLDRRGIDGSTTAPVGPGNVNLLSGEFSMDEADVSINGFLQNLTLSRTYRSRGVSRRTSDLFGPQWEASVEADGGEQPYKGIYNYTEIRDEVIQRHALNPEAWNWELFFETFEFEDLGADIETFSEIRRWEYRYAVVENSDGTKFTFTQTLDPDGRATGWEPDDVHPGYRLEHIPGPEGANEFRLVDPSGAVAKFGSEAPRSPNYRLQSFVQPGSTAALSYSYSSVGTRQRLTRVSAPLPTGGVARSLVLVWSDIPTPGITGTASLPRVTSVRFLDGHGTDVPVAAYSYDNRARLIRVWDPRLDGSGLPTEYVYDTQNRLAEVRPPGEEEWRLTYTQRPGDEGPRLATVARDDAGGGVATTTLRYDVPVSGAGAPYDLGYDETRAWGQEDDLPWDAVAIFPEDDVPSETSPDYSSATIYYLGKHGRAVNVATPGGHIETAEFDANGKVIRELSATNRARALATGANSAATAQLLSTRYQYAANGVDLVATLEPETQIKLNDGRTVAGRRVTSTHYDNDAPSGGPYHLPTSVWRAVEIGPGNRVDDRELLRNSYADGGWAARQATSVTVDPNGRALVTRSFLHPNYPLIEETRTPEGAGGGATADVQFFQYYGLAPSSRVPAGIAASGCSSYRGPSYPSGFLCLRSEATLPDSQIPRRWYDYNPLGLVIATWETRALAWSSSGSRTTSNSYDAAGRLLETTVAGGVGTAVPTTRFAYSAATGRQTEVTTAGRGAIRRTFDSNGRLSQYVDSSGTISQYQHDRRGRLVRRTIDGARTTSYEYDRRDNRTSVDDSEVGSAITATYGPDDELLSESLPNGLTGTFDYDTAGRTQRVTWDDTTACSSDCTWVESRVVARNADGNITRHQSTESDQAYGYDTVQRLTSVDDTRTADNSCVRRVYAYDVESNRIQRSRQTARSGDSCGTGALVTRNWTHDDADRVTNSGWTYDSFGRATVVPAADSGGTGVLNSSYYVNDFVQQMTLDGRTHTYARDPLERTKSIASSGASKPAVTSTNRYADDSDAPAAVERSGSGSVTYVNGPSGRLLATKDDGTLTYGLRDVHGSVVAVASAAASEARPSRRTETDEFGVVTSTSSPVVDNTRGVPANGWLGGHQRTTEFGQAEGSGGPMQMGARVYLPAVGRFLQVDPVDGGSANAYDYVFQNPVNVQDLDGRCPICGVALVIGSRMAVQQAARIVGASAAKQVVARAGSGAAARQVAARNAKFARTYNFELKSTSKKLLERMKGSRGDGGIAPWAVNHALHHGVGQCTGPNVYTFTSKYAQVLVNSQTGKIFNGIPKTSAANWGKAPP